MIVNFGNPNDFDKINDIIRDKDIFIRDTVTMGLPLMINRLLWNNAFLHFSHHMATMEGGDHNK